MHIFDIQQNISKCVENSATLNEEVPPSLRKIVSLLTVFPDFEKKVLFTTGSTWLFGSKFAFTAIFLLKITNFTIYSDLILQLTGLAYSDIVTHFYLPIDIGSLYMIDAFHRTKYLDKALDFLVISKKSEKKFQPQIFRFVCSGSSGFGSGSNSFRSGSKSFMSGGALPRHTVAPPLVGFYGKMHW